MAHELDPDVVALDISMPVMDGFEAAAELEKFAHPPAILMLTGSSAPEDVDRARRVGAKGYITKDAIAAGSSTRSSLQPAFAGRAHDGAATLCAPCCRSRHLPGDRLSRAAGADPDALRPRRRPRRHGLHARLPGRHAHRRAEPDPAHGRGRDASSSTASCSTGCSRPKRPATLFVPALVAELVDAQG